MRSASRKRSALVCPRWKSVTSWPRESASSTSQRPTNSVPPNTRMRNGRSPLGGAELQRVQTAIDAVGGQKLLVCPLLDDASPVEHHDTVGAQDGREAVRDQHDGAPAHQALDRFLDGALAFRIEVRGG